MEERIGLAILGATGSIGEQALQIVNEHPQLFEVVVLTTHTKTLRLKEMVQQYNPKIVVITDEKAYQECQQSWPYSQTQLLFGQEGLCSAVTDAQVHTVLAAIVGFAGLHSTIAAIEAGKRIALANKETLVVAGEIVMPLAQQKNVAILPVDSEHSAIFQCLQGETHNPIEKLILTASGGPFLGRKPNFLVNVKKEHALQHPNWTMGAKITIDSSTLMNKGLELIEAKWLFNLEPDQLEVVVHQQSIIHSLVQFTDGSLKAQMGLPDMKLPIQYALCYPNRQANKFKRFSFRDYATLTFEQPDTKTFRNLALAQVAMTQGGIMPCVLNAANEMVVAAFLNNRVGFIEMSDIIEETMNKVTNIQSPTLQQLVLADTEARNIATEFIAKSPLAY